MQSFILRTRITVALLPSVSNLFGKTDLKRMRHSPFLIITVLYQLFIGKSSTRNISLILFQLYNIKLSHVTIADWSKKFAPLLTIFTRYLLLLWTSIPMSNMLMNNGKKYYIWFVINSETRFVLGFHLYPFRSSPQAHYLFSHTVYMGNPKAIVSDRYSAYKVPSVSSKKLSISEFKALRMI